MLATPTEITHFIEIFRTRHISRAAIRLGITQPSLTQSLQKLEEKIGAQLFYRSKQGVTPTPIGNAFYLKAQKVLDTWYEVKNEIYSSRTEVRGHFRLGCHPSVGAYVLPSLLRRIHESSHGISFDVLNDISRKITESVISYELDLGFVVNPVRHPDLVLKKVGDDHVTFWKKKGQTQIPKRIFADTALKQSEFLLDKAKKHFNGWNLVKTPSLELIRTLTLSGQGIGILPQRVALADQAALVVFDRQLPQFADEIFLAYRRDILSTSAGKELIRHSSHLL